MSIPTRKRAADRDASKITALEKEIALLKRERAALKEKCGDLSEQNKVLMENPVTTPQQLLEWTIIRAEYEAMKAQTDKLALWLRQFKADEIARGRHAGKDLADVVIGYMEAGLPTQ